MSWLRLTGFKDSKMQLCLLREMFSRRVKYRHLCDGVYVKKCPRLFGPSRSSLKPLFLLGSPSSTAGLTHRNRWPCRLASTTVRCDTEAHTFRTRRETPRQLLHSACIVGVSSRSAGRDAVPTSIFYSVSARNEYRGNGPTLAERTLRTLEVTIVRKQGAQVIATRTQSQRDGLGGYQGAMPYTTFTRRN